MGDIDWMLLLAIGLFIAGFILVGIEMVTPGLHAPGIAGTACLVAAVFLVSDSFVEGAVVTIIVLFLIGVMLAIILGLLSNGTLKSPIVLKEEQKKDEGYISSEDLQYLLGKQGVAVTDLRPTGIADFDGIDTDVMTEGKYILKGTKVVVIKVKGYKILVKELQNDIYLSKAE